MTIDEELTLIVDLTDDEKEEWLSLSAIFLLNEDLDKASESSKKTLADLAPFLYRSLLLKSLKKKLPVKQYRALVKKIMDENIVYREDLDFEIGKEILEFEIRNTGV
ncbi:hypothetical protein ES695_16310 [Candidatus Atribacteria bacterium 1244-E10-H5-B2]|nr:MAG: hypothetical protein ES695_16310 [Candidatus Atribacteria bacterium 1244-E10-H5-B2]